MQRYRLTVAYEGTDFHGWQKQHPKGAAPLRTVQGVLEEAICTVVREAVALVGASRTDAGVHAEGQVAAFTTSSGIARARLLRAINGRLPADVQVSSLAPAAADFDPIADAVVKTYRYRIAHGGAAGVLPPLFDRRLVTFSPYTLDAGAMARAAAALVGTHDFASFTRVSHGRESTVRSITACTVKATSRTRLRIDVTGDGFLYNMVRIIAGTLVEVGRGRLGPEDIPRIIAQRDRDAAGPTMPPQGLCLMKVRYTPRRAK
jgi:tRNA pseudouridine38-40 synthase